MKNRKQKQPDACQTFRKKSRQNMREVAQMRVAQHFKATARHSVCSLKCALIVTRVHS